MKQPGPAICVVDACDRPVRSSGLCGAHYEYVRKRQLSIDDVMALPANHRARPGSARAWIDDHLAPLLNRTHLELDEHPCVLLPSCFGGEYGEFILNGRHWKAHRYAAFKLFGPPSDPQRQMVNHLRTGAGRSHDKRCLIHTYYGSQAENNADRDADGATSRGASITAITSSPRMRYERFVGSHQQ